METIKDKKILLIGGAGFIGHHLAISLKRNGACVRVIDSLNVNSLLHHASDNFTYSSDRALIPVIYQRLLLLQEHQIMNTNIDACDLNEISLVIKEERPDVVVFLAALSNAVYSNQQPYIAFENNLRALNNVLCASRGIVKQIIFFSSSMVYGDFSCASVSEDTPCVPKGIYGSLKLMGEQLCELYHRQYGLEYTIIRPSALYGNRCVSRRVSQLFIERAIRGEDVIIEGDGSARLDFTHVDDLVQGVTHCIGHPKAINQVFNITYGSSRNLRDLLDILIEYFPSVNIVQRPLPASYVKRGTLSIDKACSLIGYAPKMDISRGYRSYIEWCIANEQIIQQFNAQFLRS